MRIDPRTGRKLRTDISATLFLSEPDDYDGGELEIEDTYGAHSVKLAAGDLILYPATSLHQVTPITRGGAWRRSSGSRAWCATMPSARCCSSSTRRSSA